MLRVGVVGLGFAGATLHVPALERRRDVALVGTVDPDPSRSATFADLDALLERGVDAVVIASPVESHYELSRRALDAGSHVYVEKPMTDSVATAEALAAALPPRRVLQVGFAYRFHPLWQRLFALAGAGRLRAPWRAEGQFRCPPGEGWHHPMIEVGSHHVDLLRRLQGEAPTEVDTVEGALCVRWSDGSELRGWYGPQARGDTMTITFAGDQTVTVRRQNGVRLRGAGLRAAVPDPVLLRARQRWTGWERSFDRALGAFVEACISGHAGSPGPADGVAGVRVNEATLRALARTA